MPLLSRQCSANPGGAGRLITGWESGFAISKEGSIFKPGFLPVIFGK